MRQGKTDGRTDTVTSTMNGWTQRARPLLLRSASVPNLHKIKGISKALEFDMSPIQAND